VQLVYRYEEDESAEIDVSRCLHGTKLSPSGNIYMGGRIIPGVIK
jgi:hypothetical protein